MNGNLMYEMARARMADQQRGNAPMVNQTAKTLQVFANPRAVKGIQPLGGPAKFVADR